MFFGHAYITSSSLKHHQLITSASTYIITSHHKTLQLTTSLKTTILGPKKGSKMTPKTTPKNDPFLTLFDPTFIVIKSSSSTSSKRRQRPQKHVFLTFSTFWKTENFFSKLQIKYPLIRPNYFGGPVLGVQATGSGEVMPIWGRSSWITVPNHTILSARP